MKLNDGETLLEEGPGLKVIRRTYPAGHSYGFKFCKSELYCPHCGAKDVWVEDSGGDYYVGPEHRCGDCGAEFHLP